MTGRRASCLTVLVASWIASISCAAAFPSAAPELFQAGTERGAVVRIVHERHGLDDNGDERELRVPEQGLHEPCETELKSPRALVGHEKRDCGEAPKPAGRWRRPLSCPQS